MTVLHITGTAWGPRCECPEVSRAHYHGSAFLIQEAADENCRGCRADAIAAPDHTEEAS